MDVLTNSLIGVFAALALLHLYWAAGGRWGVDAALPSDNEAVVTRPSPMLTGAVAAVLAGIAAILWMLSVGSDTFPVLLPYATLAGYAVGIVLVLRAVGEFRYLGFSKRIKGTKFAVYDSWLFSPFCLAAGIIFLILANSVN